MPNFHSRPKGGLLTPPGSGQNMYGYRSNVQGQYGQNRKSMYDPTGYAAPAAPLMYQPPPMHYGNMSAIPPPGLPNGSFGPIAAPILPPISDRNADIPVHNVSSRHERHQERRNQQPAAKKEKITGGVAQELDYEMDQMTDYVSDMAQSIVMPSSTVSPAFRKFVSGLLSSTRLPSSTILLGLNYLARRMNMLNTPNPRKTTDGQVWRMLTISLLLGSKFLDDNTFQNRSWSEVSGIPVVELNTLEKEWLDAIEWNLHVDALTNSDYQSWLASWASWKENKNKERNAVLDRLAPLAPLDTNSSRQHTQRKKYSPASGYPSYDSRAHQAPWIPQSRYDQSVWSQSPTAPHELSPPSAPDSGLNTPEWTMLPGSGLPPTEWYNYPSFYNRRNHQPAAHNPYIAAQAAPYHNQFYGHYQQNDWGHPSGCGCGYCGRNDSYLMGQGYSQQTVVG